MSNTPVPAGAPGPENQLQAQDLRPPVPQRAGYPLFPSTTTATESDEDVIDLRAYWAILVRRRWTIFTVVSVAVVAGLLATFLATPIYRSGVLLQIEQESGKVVDYESVTPDNIGDSKDFYQTQYELLQSRTLARRVIDQLGLRSSPTFAPDSNSSYVRDSLTTLKSFLSGDAAGDVDEEGGKDFETLFLDNLIVTPVKNSRLVRVEFESPDPKEAAEVANAVAENFVNTTLERRYEASSYAKTFLEERIQQVRANLEDSERRLVDYAKEREIINLDDKLDILMGLLKDMSKQQVTAESERIAAEAEYQQMSKNGAGVTAGALESPVIQTLKERQAELTAQYQDKLKIFKPGYPEMQQIKQRIAEVDRQIAAESATIGAAAKATYEAKLQQEAKITARINEIKGEILALQDRSTDYQTLKREVDTNRQLYDGLLQRMKEVGIVAGIGTNNISIVDNAEIPFEKYSPSLKKNLAIAIALGLFGGIALTFLLETLDDSVKSTDEVERRIGVPVLSLIPWMRTAKAIATDENKFALLAFRDPKSALAEAYRSLRTSLVFATAEGAPKILHFTSSGPGEGKTTSACATAITFAQSGSKVLLIDCDLRNPTLQKVFRLPNSEGLTNYLTSKIEPAQIAKATEVTRLFVVTSGPLPPNPVELLSGARIMDLLQIASERFDYVILDGPPVIGLADALILANLARATLFVVESAGTRAGALEGSVKRLRAANANILGAVFMKHGRAGDGYGYGYGYEYAYTYGGPSHKSLTQQVPS